MADPLVGRVTMDIPEPCYCCRTPTTERHHIPGRGWLPACSDIDACLERFDEGLARKDNEGGGAC